MKPQVITVVALVFLAAEAPKQDAGKKDLERMQGDWNAVEMVRDGVKLSDDEVEIIFRTVKGDQYAVSLFDKVIGKGTFKLDATKKPKAIDALPTGGKTMLGIYEFDGGRLKTCFAPSGKERPTEFRSKENSGHTLTVWEREKK